MAVDGTIIDTYYLTLTLLVTIGMQLSMFAVAWTFRFDKVTDISGSMNFVFLAWLVFWAEGTYYTRQIVSLVLVTVWAFRLGGFLLYRVLKRGKDERFDEMRDSFGKFLGFWIFQMIWVWVVSLPVVMLNACSKDADLRGTDYGGWACFGVGFLCESYADYSKDRFAEDASNRGKFLNVNIWSISRHPNYFGEILVWIGFYLMGTAAFDVNSKWLHFSVIAPIFTFLLLMFVSGIPMSEERYDRRYGRDPNYREYKRETAPLIPTPNSVYRAMPDTLKLLCCCEFPFYSSALNEMAAAPSTTTATSAAKSADATELTAQTPAAAAAAAPTQVVVHLPASIESR